jgi:chromatin remodeling complex protein RSC6
MAPTKKPAPVPEVVPPPPAPQTPVVVEEPKKKVVAKAVAKDAVKDASKEDAKVVPKDAPKDAPKEEVKEVPVKEEGVEDKDVVEDVFKVLVDKISSLTTLNKEIQVALKQVSKDYDKLKKIVDKIQKKRENARKSPSGFAKPNKISEELCEFIGVPQGTEKSRTDITRYINSYVKEHNLNKPDNKRIILPDEKLKKILNVKEGDVVTFFVLQRLISHHFPPKK